MMWRADGWVSEWEGEFTVGDVVVRLVLGIGLT